MNTSNRKKTISQAKIFRVRIRMALVGLRSFIKRKELFLEKRFHLNRYSSSNRSESSNTLSNWQVGAKESDFGRGR